MVHLQIAELTPSYRAPRYHTRVIPVIAYAGANDEYRKALEDYRKDDFDNCLVKCGSAFESILKVLCDKNKITFDSDKDLRVLSSTGCS